MKYVLLAIFLNGDGALVSKIDTFDIANDCYRAREGVVEMIGRPIYRYQVICLIDDGGKYPRRKGSRYEG